MRDPTCTEIRTPQKQKRAIRFLSRIAKPDEAVGGMTLGSLLTGASILACRQLALARCTDLIALARLSCGLRRLTDRRFEREDTYLCTLAVFVLFAGSVRKSQ